MPSPTGFCLSITALIFIGAGCESTTNQQISHIQAAKQATNSVAPSPSTVATGANPPSATINSLPIAESELAAAAFEAAGSVILEERILDAMLDKELAAANLSLSTNAVEEERQMLFSRITEDAKVAQDQAGVLVERFRRNRGIGPSRFNALLTRNAKLRLLVRRNHVVEPGRTEQLAAIETGPKTLARLITLPTAQQAQSALSQLTALSPAERSAKFSQLAYTISNDPSAARGGIFGPVSAMDETIPPTIRQQLTLPAGSLSPVLAMESGFALLLIEQQLAAPEKTPSLLEQALARATLKLEREAMEKLASQLLAEARVTVLHEGLRWSWENRLR